MLLLPAAASYNAGVSPKKGTAEIFVNVAVMAAIRHPLTYRVPDSLDVRVGQRVVVPLGNRRAAGVVVEPVVKPAPGLNVRDILRVLDPEALLSPELMTLGVWIADYYLAPVGEVFRAMLPLRADTVREQVVSLTEKGLERVEEYGRDLSAVTNLERTYLAYFRDQAALRGAAPLDSFRRKFGKEGAEWFAQTEREGLITVTTRERQRKSREVYSVVLTDPLSRSSVRISPAAQRIVAALERGPVEDHRELVTSARTSLARLKRLQQEGLIGLRPGVEGRTATALTTASGLDEWPELAGPQTAVFKDLRLRLEKREFGVVLLHGITASGKTEVYLRLIRHCLAQDRTALMLVPEIALTPALQELYSSRLGARVAMLHSGLSELDRHKEWWRARRGEARVALGTRSAVFAPLENLGLLIVDEEHDSSYKQQETPRYHGRDVAVVRARLARALAVLGSATPSLESYLNAREGKYHLARLEERIGGRPLASVEIVDMRQEFRETVSRVPISRRLKEEMDVQLKSGAQTMILLNRRGFAWFLLCRSCGQSVGCANCSISLTYHRREHRLICHYCGFSAAVPSRCPACGSEYLNYVGEGTEKIESKLAEMFPGARVARLDRDVARRPAQFARILSDFRQGKIDILVGTQMIAKGHDFQGVTLVGVVSVDAGLALPDFRAAERTFQLLAQAAGRAGRGSAPGRVLVQTFYPDHYAVRFAAQQNFEAFFEKEIRFRRTMHYPPVTAFANVVAQDANLVRAAKVARKVEEFFQTVEKPTPEVRVLGPAPAPLARLEGKYRLQFLLRSKSRARLHSVVERMSDFCYRHGVAPRALMIDVDPVSVM